MASPSDQENSLRLVGPGLVTGASDDDPSGPLWLMGWIATAVMISASFTLFIF